MGNLCLCEACANVCHKDHEIIPHPSNAAFCDCGYGCGLESCKCLNLLSVRSLCTRTRINKKINQRAYSCKTCNISYICNSCKENCHKFHDIFDNGLLVYLCQCSLKTCLSKGNISYL